MRINGEQLEAWLFLVKGAMKKCGVTEEQLTYMKETRPLEHKDMELMCLDMLPGNFHPAVNSMALDPNHPALQGPARAGVHLFQVFFE